MPGLNTPLLSAFAKATFCNLLLSLTIAASGQLLKPVSEHVWLNSGKGPGKSVPYTFVGNYPVLDRGSMSFSQGFQTVAGERSGTLFMVIRPKKDSLSDKRLLKLGPVSLYKDSVLVDGHKIDIAPIEDKPVIIKVQYQGRPGRRWFSKPYDIRPEIDLAELVYYDAMLNKHQARIVESFLALKYSINITANSNPELRDYVSLYDEKVWNVKTDSLYDQEVLGLGRMDQVGFYQSQTMTADSKKIKVSLDSAWSKGGMPTVAIQDSSLLVLSKANPVLAPFPCGGSPTKYLWKLRLFDWQSTAQTLRIETDTPLTITNPVITNGQHTYPVQLSQQGQHTIMEIPLSNLDPQWDYFIAATDTTNNCPPVYSVAVTPCDSNLINTLTINLSTLPANLRLTNLTTGSTLEKTVTASMAQVSGLDPGQYELLLNSSNGLILDTVFVLEPCDSTGAVPELSVKAGQGNDPTTSTASQWVYEELTPKTIEDLYTSRTDLNAAKKGASASAPDDKTIGIFPNPATRYEEISIEFTRLEEEAFTIQVIDSKGALLKQTIFTPKAETATWHYSFPQAGTYLLRVFSQNYIATEHIIVRSTHN